MPPRYLVFVKLLEVFARGGFVVFCTYALPLVDAGRFGVLTASIGAATFLIGFERYVDVQRRMYGADAALVRGEFRRVLRFFMLQYLFVVVVAVPLTAWVTAWPTVTLAALALILAAEHLGNQAYLATLVDGRGYPLLVAACVKSLLLTAGCILIFLFDPEGFAVKRVIHLWGVVSFVFLVVLYFLWRAQDDGRLAAEVPANGWTLVPAQYRASLPHFLTGLLAFIAVQADRFVVSGLLSPEDVGVYFRNLTVVALLTQFISIVSYNRAAPRVMGLMRDQGRQVAQQLAFRECGQALIIVMLILAGGLALDWLLGRPTLDFHINPGWLVVLTLGVLLRVLGDFGGLMLLSMKRDRRVLISQVISVLVGVPVLGLSTWTWGLPGAVAGALAMPFCLMLLNGWQYGNLSTSN